MQDKPTRPVLCELPTRLWLLATLQPGFCKEKHIQDRPPSLSSMCRMGKDRGTLP